MDHRSGKPAQRGRPRQRPATGTRWRALRCVWRRGDVAVWYGEHVDSGQAVALKTLANDDPGRALQYEAWAAAGLSHPNLHPVLDLVRVALPDAVGQPVWCLVTPWAALGSAHVLLGAARLAHVQALVQDVLAGLIHAHGRGVVHRDLKPSNLLLWGSAAAWRVRLADFGIAQALGVSPAADQPEGPGGAWGSPGWMAPEQVDPDGPIGPWTDLYGLGRVVEALRAPLPAEEDPADPTHERIEAWLQCALAHDPGDRFPSAAHALAAWPSAPDGDRRPALLQQGAAPQASEVPLAATTQLVWTPLPRVGASDDATASRTPAHRPAPAAIGPLTFVRRPPDWGLLDGAAGLPDGQWGPDLLRWRATPNATDPQTAAALRAAIDGTLRAGEAQTLHLVGADLSTRIAAIQSVSDGLVAAGALVLVAGEHPEDSWVEDLARLVAGALGLPPRANATASCLPRLLARLQRSAALVVQADPAPVDPAGANTRTAALGRDAAPDPLLLAQLGRLLDGAGWWRPTTGGSPVTRDAVFRDRSESVWATVRVLQLAARLQPIVLVLHEVDVRGDLAGLAQGATHATWAQGLVVVQAQASAGPAPPGNAPLTVDVADAGASVRALARAAPLDPAACRRLGDLAGGNLATAMRALRDAVDDGMLLATGDGWTLAEPWWRRPWQPNTIWSHASARCVRGDRNAAALLRALLPLGLTVLHHERAALALAAHRDDRALRPGGVVWTALVRAGVWIPSHDGVRWDPRAHAAAWEALAPPTQRRLARRALAVVAAPQATADPIVAQRALALAIRAGANAVVAPRAVIAARAWLRLGAPHTALACIAQAVRPSHPTPPGLALLEATALHAAGRTQDALDRSTALHQRLRRRRTPQGASLRAEALRVVAVSALTLGQLAQADAACQAMQRAVASGAGKATSAAEPSPLHEELWLLEAVLASVQRRWTPTIVQQLVTLANQDQTRPYAAARGSLLLAEAQLHRGDEAASLASTQRALDIGRAHGLGTLVLQALNLQGEIARRAGDIPRAYAAFQTALPGVDPRAGLAGYLRYNLAAACVAMGRATEALPLLEATAAPAGSRLWLFVELARLVAAAQLEDLATVHSRWPAVYAVLAQTALRDEEYVSWCTALAQTLGPLTPEIAHQAQAVAVRLQPAGASGGLR